MVSINNTDMRDAFFEPLVEIALKNQNIIILSADHAAFSLIKFQKEAPDRYFNIGISEQNMMGLAAGLASKEKIVFAYGISPFVSLRVLEQITLDIAALGLNVNIVSVGSGFTYSTDGPSHHGIQDINAVMTVPNLEVYNSSDPSNTKYFAELATRKSSSKYIRIEKGILPNLLPSSHDYDTGVAMVKNGKDMILISSGSIVHECCKAAYEIEKRTNKKVGVIDIYRLKPFPHKKLIKLIVGVSEVVTIEEGLLSCGVGSLVATCLLENNIRPKFLRIGINDMFCLKYGSRDYLRDEFGLSSKKIVNRILSRN